MLNQTCSLKLQVCLSMCDLLVDTWHKRVKETIEDAFVVLFAKIVNGSWKPLNIFIKASSYIFDMVPNTHLLCLTIISASSKEKMAFVIALMYLGSELVIPGCTVSCVEVFWKVHLSHGKLYQKRTPSRVLFCKFHCKQRKFSIRDFFKRLVPGVH